MYDIVDQRILNHGPRKKPLFFDMFFDDKCVYIVYLRGLMIGKPKVFVKEKYKIPTGVDCHGKLHVLSMKYNKSKRFSV